MKTFRITLIMVFSISSIFSVEAQFERFKKRIQDKVEQKLERKIDQKVDQEIDKTLDEVFEGKEDQSEEGMERSESEEESDYKEKSRDANYGALRMKKVTLTDKYHFTTQVDWEMTSDGEDVLLMNQFYPDNASYLAMTTGSKKRGDTPGFMIMDLKKNHMVIVTGEDNQAMLTSMDIDEEIDEAYEDQGHPKITKTSEQKKILGYTCTKYLYNDNRTEGEMWLTNDLDFKNHNLMEQLNASHNKHLASNPDWSVIKDGFALEVHTQTDDGEKYIMVATAINTNVNVTHDLSEYEIMDMTHLQKAFRK